ncbi:unnamed protein product [Rodentolepis nana]|uniref:Vacuolar protein sorting-associated protein 13D n=1 Tax=Rodentolepis nana TaxID=102285 RepID=A0A0R3TRH7_RODNA|nr:unnamed protein product [Rodentolepis nana]
MSNAEYSVANRYLPLLECEFYANSPSSFEKSLIPIFYSRRESKPSNFDRSIGCLPGLFVKVVSDSTLPKFEISDLRLFRCSGNENLMICITNDNCEFTIDRKLMIRPLSSCAFSWTFIKSTKKYIFAVIPPPQSFTDIYLQIHTADWIVHLANPLDLDDIKSCDEEPDGNVVEDAASELTHPWKSVLECDLEEYSAKEILRRIFSFHAVLGEWATLRQGLFSGCRVRLSRSSTGKLNLEALSCHRNMHHLLIDRLKREGFVVLKGSWKSCESVVVNLNDFRDALLTELRLLKSAFCGPLIRHIMESKLPLITDALPGTYSALQVASTLANLRDLGSGCKPIDRSVISEVVNERSIGAIASACASTNSILSRLSV